MSSAANVRSIAALDEMNNALKRFQSDALNVLNATDIEIKRTMEWLKERLQHWQNELRRRRQALDEAQRALYACLRSENADCSGCQAAVYRMQRLVQEAEHELQVAVTHMKRVDEAAMRYRSVAGHLATTLNGQLVQGTVFLSNRANILYTYAGSGSGGSSSGSVGVAGGAGMPAASMEAAINGALASGNRGTELEGTVASWIKNDLMSFQRDIGPGGSIGEIDIETSKAIIETTIQRADKLKQIKKLLTNTQMNPNGKPVILFAPNYGDRAAQDIIHVGAYVARTKEELLQLLQRLGG